MSSGSLPAVLDRFPSSDIVSVHAGSAVLDSYCCMHEVVRKIFVLPIIDVEYKAGFTDSVSRGGFFCFDQTMWFVSRDKLDSTIPLESAFVCMGVDLPSKIFKDDFPEILDVAEININSAVEIHSTPSMMTSWSFRDTLPLRREDLPLEADYHINVASATKAMQKYLKRPPTGDLPLPSVLPEFVGCKRPLPEVQPTGVTYSSSSSGLPSKRTKDAREFREQILSNGAQAEFFVWNHIKAAYGDAADLTWWLTSTKRQFFPKDLTPIDDAAGADFRIPSDAKNLFASKRGAPVQIEVKGTGRIVTGGITFEISRNELKTAQEAAGKNEEYVIAVVSGLAGFGRPQLETIIRDTNLLDLVPVRFLATLKPTGTPPADPSTQPALTRSPWT